MSEVLGDDERPHDADDFDNIDDIDNVDDYEYDDGFDDEPGAVRRAVASVLTPGALAIAALAIAAASLLVPFSGYIIATAVTASHITDQLYGPRVLAIVQLVTAGIAITLATFAVRGAVKMDDLHRRMPQMLAGGAILIAVFALVQGGTGLIVLANTHVPNFG
jgi:hypothetical protein